jgi:endonuclease YncB( thermonuclease family)
MLKNKIRPPRVLPVGGRSRPGDTGWRVRSLLAAIAVVAAGCGSDAPSQPTPPPSTASSVTVSSVTDGDTLRFSPAQEGVTVLRMLHVDAPELAQTPWGEQSRAELLRLAPAATVLRIDTEQTRIDPFGRLLGHAIRSDGLDLNREQLRLGQGVLFVIWPNVGRFEDYRAAEIEAQNEGRGIWNRAGPLTELPFEYRLRLDGGTPFRPVGDYFTRRYVDPADYRRVDVNNRVFFNNTTDAASAGYLACARNGTGGDYEQSCFSPGR